MRAGLQVRMKALKNVFERRLCEGNHPDTT